MVKKLIGFNGIAGSGKDTSAMILKQYLENNGEKVEVIAFAEPLKEALRVLFGFSDYQLYTNKEDVDDRWGKSPREILQWMGTDVLRNNIADDFFVRRARHRILESSADYVIVTDVRFDNEAELVKSMGGEVINITRTNYETTIHKDHVTEMGISKELIDVYVNNNGSIEELRSNILRILL